MDAVGKKLKEYREKHRLGIKSMAVLVGMSEEQYIDLESGLAAITAPQLMKLCSFYEVQPDVFLVQEAVEIKKDFDKTGEPGPDKLKPVPDVMVADEDDPGYPLIDEISRSKRALTAKRAVEICKKHGTEITEEDAEKVLDFVYKMAPLAIRQAMRDARWERKLKQHPYGYAMNGKGYTCRLCRNGQDEDLMWYDKFGLKCMPCQKAIDKGIVPGEIVGDDTLYYSEFDLGYYFNLKGKVLKEWIGKGLLNPRTIPRSNGKGKHHQVFLLCDHEGFLPPVTMMRIGGMVEEEDKDGEKYYRGTRWYEHVDPFEYLKDFGMMAYMKRSGEDDNPPEETADKQE